MIRTNNFNYFYTPTNFFSMSLDSRMCVLLDALQDALEDGEARIGLESALVAFLVHVREVAPGCYLGSQTGTWE